MTVLLVIALLAVALTIDYFLTDRLPARQRAAAVAPAPVVRPLSTVAAGFRLADGFRYHPGHTWAVAETPELVRVGIDDFTARVTGALSKIALPARGQWIRQGQKIIGMTAAGHEYHLVSPVEGVVTDVNERVLEAPDTARNDPYGEGWLLKVNSPDFRTTARNLFDGTLARRWMEDAGERLRTLLGTPAMAYAQDGGLVIDDLSTVMNDEVKDRLDREFFLAG